MLSAYLLVSHGSRDPRPQLAMEKLAELVCDRLRTLPKLRTPKLSFRASHNWKLSDANCTVAPAKVKSRSEHPLIGTATLELAEEPLHEQIRQFANVALAAGCNKLQVLPVFLLPGVHVMDDIPREVALAQHHFGEVLAIEQRPHLGTHPGLVKLLAGQMATVNADSTILLAHGSRRMGGNQTVETVAKQLGAMVAYWSVQPMLEEQVERLASAGYKQIVILPYFLFSGGITDAIAKRVAELQTQHSTVQLSFGEPIGATAPLADLLVDLIEI